MFWSINFPLSFSKPHTAIMKKTIYLYNNSPEIHLVNMFDYQIVSSINILKNIQVTHYAHYKKNLLFYSKSTLFFHNIENSEKNTLQSYNLINKPTFSYQWTNTQQTSFFLNFEKYIDNFIDVNSFQTYPLTFNTKKLSWGIKHIGRFNKTNFVLTFKNYQFIFNDDLLDHQHMSIQLKLQQRIFKKFIIHLMLTKALNTYLKLYPSRQHENDNLFLYHNQKRGEYINSFEISCSWNFFKTLYFVGSYTTNMHQNPRQPEFDVTKHIVLFNLKYNLTTNHDATSNMPISK